MLNCVAACVLAQGVRLIQFSLRTLLLLFVVFWTSLAAFGVFGIPIILSAVMLGLIFRDAQTSRKTIIIFVVVVVAGIFAVRLMYLGCSDPSEYSRRSLCRSCVKQITLALHNYHDDYGCFPPAYVADKEGKPMHSWRTLLLPYLDENTLYNMYDFNEPWDGPNNRKLATILLSIFHCYSSSNHEKPTTDYVAVVGPGAAWPGDHGSQIQDFKDGACDTIILVEMAGSNINWMEPRDISLDEALGKSKNNVTQVPNSGHHTIGGYFARIIPLAGTIAMADGSAMFLCERPAHDDLAAMLSIDGGDSVDLEYIEYSFTDSDKAIRYDRFFSLPLFIITLVWFWIWMVEEPGRMKPSEKHFGDSVS